MTLEKIEPLLKRSLAERNAEGTLKGLEHVVTGVIHPIDGFGPRYKLAGYGDRAFLRMNSNSY